MWSALHRGITLAMGWPCCSPAGTINKLGKINAGRLLFSNAVSHLVGLRQAAND
jgi:hypothetical protein